MAKRTILVATYLAITRDLLLVLLHKIVSSCYPSYSYCEWMQDVFDAMSAYTLKNLSEIIRLINFVTVIGSSTRFFIYQIVKSYLERKAAAY
ncbi:unnamed protein product [Rotaria socialis]